MVFTFLVEIKSGYFVFLCRICCTHNAPINVMLEGGGGGQGMGWGFDCLCCPWGRAFD